MSYFLPSIFLCISSLFFYSKLKINFSTSVLLSCLITIFFLFTLGKLGFLKEGFIVVKILIILSLFFIISNIYKKKQYKKLSKVLYFFLYFLLFLFCENLVLYKFDEFSEYGITSRLLFSENNIGINIDYLNKGTNFKPNLVSVFHYFFLSFEHRFFNEKLAYIAHNFLSFSIIIYLISKKKNYNFKNNIIIFFIIYFLSYTLSSGYDRLYVDNLISLFIALIFVIVFQKDIKKC